MTCPVMKPASSLPKKAMRAGQVVGLAQTAQRDGAAEGFEQLGRVARAFGHTGQQRGVGRAGADHVDGDALAGVFAGQRLGQGHQATLAGGIHGFARRAAACGIGRDVHDAAGLALGHAGQHRVQHVQGAGQVDGDQLLPLGGHGLGEGLENIPAGVVHQHVDGTQRGFGRGHGRVHGGAVGDVALEGLGHAAGGLDLGGHFLCGLQVHVEDGDLGAFFGKAAAGCTANATTTTGHDNGFSTQIAHVLDSWVFRREPLIGIDRKQHLRQCICLF